MANCGQPVPTRTKWVLTLIFYIIVTYQEWLKYQMFTAFQVKFHVSGSIINFPLTGNDLCHSQPNGIFFH